MFVDASAMIAMIAVEDDAEVLASRLARSPRRVTSPIACYEAATGLARALALPVGTAATMVTEFLETAEIIVSPVPVEAGPIALDAFARYGKGQGHPAQLNMGDCFAYACARHFRQPLLFKGVDFARTDIEPA